MAIVTRFSKLQKCHVNSISFSEMSETIYRNSSSSPSYLPFMKVRPTMVKTRQKLEVICRNCPDKISGDDGLNELPETSASTDVIIVGAGVSGAAPAYALAKDGRRVHVIEKNLKEPNRIVGEVLHPGGYLKLTELDLEDCVEGIEAQRVSGYVIYMKGKSIELDYPLQKFPANVSGKSFHNGRFIQRMRNKASSLPNVRLEQGTVTSLLERQGTVHGVHYRTKDGQATTAYAPLTIVCDGCFSNLRRDLCNPKIETPSAFVALVLENIDLPYSNHAHVTLADPSIILFYPISNTEIRCMIDVPGEKIRSISNGEMAKYLKTEIAPQIPPELYDAFIAAIDRGNIKSMPNRNMPAEPNTTPGAILLGDALNMRHPVTGGGMSVALYDVVLLRRLLKPLHDLNDDARYKVFRSEMSSFWFDYLSLRPMFTDGLMSVFAVIEPRPLLLLLQVAAMVCTVLGGC